MTNLPPSGGYNSILSVVDHSLTKGVILIPCIKTFLALNMTQTLLDQVYKRFGLLDKIISNWGPQFASRVFRKLLELLGIKSSLLTAYHLQSDGTTEHFNQEIEAYLSIYCIINPTDWYWALVTLEFSHNSRKHSDQAQSPFELIQGMVPIALPLTFDWTNLPDLNQRLSDISRYWREALTAYELA